MHTYLDICSLRSPRWAVITASTRSSDIRFILHTNLAVSRITNRAGVSKAFAHLSLGLIGPVKRLFHRYKGFIPPERNLQHMSSKRTYGSRSILKILASRDHAATLMLCGASLALFAQAISGTAFAGVSIPALLQFIGGMVLFVSGCILLRDLL